MKKIILLLLFFSMQPIFSQSNSNGLELNKSDAHADKCVKEFFGQELAHFKTIDPDRITYFKNVVQNRVSLVFEKNSKSDKYPKLSSIPLFNKYNPTLSRDEKFDATTFNILKYKISFFSNDPQVIRIDNSDYLIIIAPSKI